MQLKIYNVGFLGVNTYLLLDNESKEAVIIDLGGDYSKIKKDVDGLGYKIKFILNTHGHFDHLYGEVDFKKDFPEIPIYIHKDDLTHVERMDVAMTLFGLRSEKEPLKPNSVEFLDEKTDLYIGNHRISILHTPGHSNGSVSYLIDNMLFSGDALFQRSIGRTDLYDGDYDKLVNSIKNKILTLSDDTVVYPGHGPKTTVSDEKKYNVYLK